MARRRMTSRDVADRAEISTTTVSFVLNNVSDVKISDDTRRCVLKAARKLDYQAISAARPLVSGKTQHIAILAGEGRERVRVDAFRPFFVWGITTVARPHGYPVVFQILEDISSSKDYANPGQTFPGRGNA